MTDRRMAALVLCAVAVLAGCGGDDGTSDAGRGTTAQNPTVPTSTPAVDADVTIDTFIFSPDPIEVSAGSGIVFRNDDDILHTVTQGTRDAPITEGFDLQLDGEGTSGEIVIAGTGTIDYFCSIHAGMDAQIVVS